MNEIRPTTIEFVVKRDFEKNLPQILSNIAEVKEWAAEQTKVDRALILQSDEDFDEARKRCAAINKIIQGIDGNRKDIKKAYNAPYEIFEKSLKEVTAILTEARENLWGQITAAENEQKAKKEAEYFAYYNSLTGAQQWRSWAQIFDKTWLNKGKSDEVIKAEINKIVELQNTDIAAIKSLQSEFTVGLIQYYKDGHSLSETIAYNTRLCAEKQALKEEMPVAPKIEPHQEETSEIITVDFRVQCTSEKLKALGEYMKRNNIRYGKIPEKE